MMWFTSYTTLKQSSKTKQTALSLYSQVWFPACTVPSAQHNEAGASAIVEERRTYTTDKRKRVPKTIFKSVSHEYVYYLFGLFLRARNRQTKSNRSRGRMGPYSAGVLVAHTDHKVTDASHLVV